MTDSNRALVQRARDSLAHALAPFKPNHTKAEAEQVLAELNEYLATTQAQDVAGLVEGRRQHDLKTWPGPFAAIAANLKPWELRFNDRDFRVGDILNLHEWTGEMGFTGAVERRRVIFVLEGGNFGLPEGYVIMSLAAFRTSPTREVEGLAEAAGDNNHKALVEVPREPTAEMIRAAIYAKRDDNDLILDTSNDSEDAAIIYRAMIAAAPAPGESGR